MYNKAILIGRLCADPELKTTQSGISVCSFRIACDRNYANKDGERSADFINIVAWRQTAEFVSKFFTKGKQIGVEGSIHVHDYTDKDGNKRTAADIQADRCFFTESKGNDTPKFEKPVQDDFEGLDSSVDTVEDDDDLPF